MDDEEGAGGATRTRRRQPEVIRRERLAEAMRENLRRRKTQQRGRAHEEPRVEPVEEG